MLEVSHLKKTYHPKKGEPVKALDDVSLKFPETGLVFILGKSGSGKSTLLNIMGGLDKADSGEIIIDGKSSSNFAAGEMDSYRNTYLGFIFQEYNILSDYTIKENIALALELQHKKVTNEAIDSILKEVDLEGMGKRKPNELSGGQKQRVAIARALVKEPHIIFGDEPTGALDSKTGQQVFETLKKLSKSKLVVIVSHDREFAEHFGDRVIELRDGQVISDITKTIVTCSEPSKGLSLIGDNVIRLEKGRTLTEDDLPILNKAIESSDGEIYISGDSHVNGSICESARIDENGNREEFENTDLSKIESGNNEFKTIKSHFSFGHAFRMGAKSLKVKPVRLVMTILLSVVAFSFFGTSATLGMFNTQVALKSAIKKQEINALTFSKKEVASDGEGLSPSEFTSSNLKEIADSTGVKIYTLTNANIGVQVIRTNDAFHTDKIAETATISSDDFLSITHFKMSVGNLPKDDTEIAITKYTYYTLKDFGIGTQGSSAYCAPTDVTEEKVIGTTLGVFKVSGIIDTGFDEDLLEYRDKNTTDITGIKEQKKYAKLKKILENDYSIHKFGYVGKSSGTDEFGLTGSETVKEAVAVFENSSKIDSFLDYYIKKQGPVRNASLVALAEPGEWAMYGVDATLSMVETVSTLIVVLTNIFIWVGAILAAFAILLFYSFMSISINNKKREIGILRAVGAKRSDVFKIFYSESFIIAMINFLFALANTYLLSWLINSSTTEITLGSFDLMVVSPWVPLMILAISIFASFIASIIPVARLANKRPIDAIKNK